MTARRRQTATRVVSRLVSKLELTVIAASIVVGTIWIERAHRTVIDAPAPGDLAVLSRAAACPDNDNVPYSARCLSYMSGWFWRANAAESAAAPADPAR